MRAVRSLIILIIAAAALAETPEQAAQNVLTSSEDALQELAARDEPDPWLVVDELCALEKHDVAAAFAKAAPRKAVAALPAYVASRRGREPEREARAAVVAMNAAFDRSDWKAALAATGAGIETTSIPRIRLVHGRGLALARLDRREESAKAYATAADGARALGWLKRLAQVHHDRGQLAFNHSDWSVARAAWQAKLELAAALGDRQAMSVSFQDLGIVHRRLGEPRQALEAFRRALEMEELLDDRPGIAWTLDRIGATHRVLGQPDEAVAAYRRSVEVKAALDDQAGVAESLHYIGMVLLRRRDYPAAREAFQRVLEIEEALDDKLGASRALNNLGIIHLRRKRYPQAHEAFRRSLELKEVLDDRRGSAKALNNLGVVLRALRRYREALAAYQRSLAIREALDDQPAVASTLHNIGLVYRRLNEHRKSLAAHRRSLEIYERVGNESRIGIAYLSIGDAHRSLGEFSAALGCYRRALELAGDDQRTVASALNNLGRVHRLLGEYRQALKVYRRSLAINRERDAKKAIAETLNNIGSVHSTLRESEPALVAYRAALEILESLDDKANAAVVRHNIANVLHAQGESEKALVFYRGALELQEALGDKPVVAEILNNLGVVHRDLKQYDEALSCHRRALEVLEQTAAPVTRARALWGLAQAHYGKKEWQASVDRAREAVLLAGRFAGSLGEQQGASARGRWSELFIIGARAAARTGVPEDTAFFLESGRAGSLRESLSSREALRAALIPERLRAEEAKARAVEAKAVATLRQVARAGDRKRVRQARKVLDDARTALDDVVVRIQREAKAGAAIAYPVADDLKTIQARLGDHDALVLFDVAAVGAMALVVRRESAHAVALGESAAIGAACGSLLLDAAPFVDPERVAGLRELVTEPLKLGDDVSRVLVSPTGRLGYVPFALLLPEREVVYMPSGTTHGLLAAQRELAGEGVLALGDPNYRTIAEETVTLQRGAAITKLTPLPGTRAEVAAIAGVRLLGDQATESGLADALEGHGRWRAVHFACHGLIDPDHPMLSALALTADDESDGFLTCREVFDLKIPTDLVVLSACETGKGKIYRSEGIVGFTRAFMYAGAPRVIVSLWKVDDAATKALMVKFYELWKKIPTATALKQAQEFVASHPKWKHPYYWAAWQLWGLPD